MSTDAARSSLADPSGHYRLQVNSYDRTASLLVALLIMAVTVFLSILIVFLFRTFKPTIVPKEVEMFDPGELGEAPKGYAEEPEPPGLEDAPDIIPPQLQDTLSAISDAAATKAAMLSDQVFDAADRAGKGSGLGDKRNTGVGGGSGEDGPKEMKYEPASLLDYKQMLDFFEVELAVVKGDKVYYASNLASPNPTIREGTRADEVAAKRFRFISTGNPLRDMELKIARETRIMKNGGLILTFWPDEHKGYFYGIERTEMRKNKIENRTQVRKTVYRFFRKGTAYDYEVESQTYY